MATPETRSRTGFTRGAAVSAASASTETQKICRKLLTRASIFRPQTSHAAALKDVCISLMELYAMSEEETTNSAEIEDTLLSILPPASSFFTTGNYRAPTFPLKLLKEVCDLYTVLQVDANVFNSLGKRTKRHPTANYFSGFWVAVVGTEEYSKMLNMLNNLYEANNLSFVQFTPFHNTKMSPSVKQEIEFTNKPEKTATIVAEEPRGVQSEHASEQFPINVPAKMYGSDAQRYNDNTKRANVVVNYFRDRYFNGDITQSINRTYRDFEICAAQFKLTELEKATYIENILEPPARNFFSDNYSVPMSYHSITKMMKKEHGSPTRQATVQSELETLRLSSLMKKKGLTDVSLGLEKLTIKINLLSPQTPPSFQSDEHKIRTLRRAVLQYP